MTNGSAKKTTSLSEFILDNKEITLKNFLINLLDLEGKNIKNKESNVESSLKFSEDKLKSDEVDFNSFTEDERGKQKKRDQVL